VVLYQPRDLGAAMPLGLVAIGSWLPDEHVVIVDGRFDLAPEARILELAREALCLGVTVRTGRMLRDALRVSAAARSAHPDLPILWGGPHATHLPGSCLATGVVDACARGAGEETFAACVSALRSSSSLHGVAGLAWPGEEGAAGETSPPLPERIPRAQYSLLDVERHFEARGERHLDYCSSRGLRPALGGTWRGLPAERLVAEVEELHDRYRPAEVLFQDEDFFADPRRVEAIARGLVRAGGTLGWQAGARPEDVLEAGGEALRLVAESRCRKLHVRIPLGVTPRGPVRDMILEAGRLLYAAGIAGRFVFAVDEAEARGTALSAVKSVARALCAMSGSFETPIRGRRRYPPEVMGPAGEGGHALQAWADLEDVPWADRRAERKLARSSFYFGEAQRPPGRRRGQRVMRVLALARVRLGFFGLDLERLGVELSTLLRTGRRRLLRQED
jgi:hypothetical protein